MIKVLNKLCHCSGHGHMVQSFDNSFKEMFNKALAEADNG